ncbi:MAG: AbrB/MazE/SpoVT family DNA-binding domain-containing protein [Candidatus Dependentiae bacterium]|nr:AbrB/MazE/SpoVT family DNA-binding domain-containing protein [Candidatus Dependentiae bacterium]
MLKKIVKYGNSCAIVLDKAILELLHMREGSIVRISTDGKTLLLTPHEPTPVEQISPTVTPQEVALEGAVEHLKEHFKKNLPETSAQELQKMADETKAKMVKCAEEFAALENHSEYQTKLALLKKKHKDAPQKLIKEIMALQQRLAPQLYAMGRELDASPLASVGRETTRHANNPFKKEAAELQKKHMAIHAKYRSAQKAFEELQNNEEYQHENALLAQQQTKPVDMRQYVVAMKELTCKYIPEWRAYQDELCEAVQEYAKKIEPAKGKKKAS